ncbi:MAG: MerR family transcriptional regulator [Micrococcales bacterium]|jgi:DNA-binding transcriptional MerR regulator|nr:MerR family transcriptional regulator [Micrococcales bacterium]
MTTTHLMGIGETVSSLRPEFPDVSVSKIRFLESEGLVAPLRTPSGYRKYTPAHLERIRYVLTMQRDHYLPLKVIAEHLDALDRGLTAPAPADSTPQPTMPETTGSDVSSLDTGVRLKAGEICRESGLSAEDLAQAVALGLLPETTDYTLDHVEAARSLAALRDCGVPVRNARPVYLAVRREVDLHTAALGQPRSGESDEQYTERARELASALVRVHVAVMRSQL